MTIMGAGSLTGKPGGRTTETFAVGRWIQKRSLSIGSRK